MFKSPNHTALPRTTGRRALRAPIALALATAALSAAGADIAAAAAPVPCTPAGTRFNCEFYPSAGAPVQAADGRVVGTLHKGTNWVLCQRVGGQVRSGAYYNNNWAWTLADNNAYGWVNAVYASGGDNNGPYRGVPDCGTSFGSPPGGAGAGPMETPPPPPAVKPCSNRWMSAAKSTGTTGDSGGDYKVSITPTTLARLAGPTATPRIWDALWTCVTRPRLNDRQRNTLYKQLDCHVRWAKHRSRFLGGPTWDLESWRSDIPWRHITFLPLALRHRCNWGGGSSSS